MKIDTTPEQTTDDSGHGNPPPKDPPKPGTGGTTDSLPSDPAA